MAHVPSNLASFGGRIEGHARRNYSASLVSPVLRNLAKYDFSPTNCFFVEMQVEIHSAIERLADTGTCPVSCTSTDTHTHTSAMTKTVARPQLQVALHWQLLSSTYCDQERFLLGGWHKHTHSRTAATQTRARGRTHTHHLLLILGSCLCSFGSDCSPDPFLHSGNPPKCTPMAA